MKKIFSIIGICFLLIPTLSAQSDSADYERRPFQFTFMFPPLSTNGVRNAQIVNDVSLNLFLGVSGGVEVFEAAGFINIDQYYMNGVQLAGFGNTVGGSVTGTQLSGFYNVGGGALNGFQGAGFVNVAGGGVSGAQAAGFINVSGERLTGVQAAGFLNVAGESDKAVQVAGFGNVAGEGSSTVQGAGFFNVAGEVDGAQAAGFVNVAGEVDGVQAAGFINVAEKVDGVQLAGFINVCDSIDGLPLAFISVVKKNGYRRFALTVDEVMLAGFSYKMGVPRLYNIYSVGKPMGPGSRWMFGAGLGTEIPVREGMQLNVEATVHQEMWIGDGGAPWFLYVDRLNKYTSVKCLFGWQVGERATLHLGPSFNVSVTDISATDDSGSWREIAPYSFYDRSTRFSHNQVRMWVGLQGSVSF